MQEKDAYILGTDNEELYRLGVQHQVWASEAQQGWKNGQFKAGDTLLDLGCGPGFCTKELAFIAGSKGKVIGVDKSLHYIQYLQKIAQQYFLDIEAVHSDFDDMQLPKHSLDGMYCRWALAWIPNPREILTKVRDAMKVGGRMVIQEYYDWSTHQTRPNMPHLSKAIAAVLRSFKEYDGEIDIGRELPTLLSELGMKIVSTRPLAKLAQPHMVEWQWPISFYETYFPRLVPLGYLKHEDVEQALADVRQLEQMKGATLFCPFMIEVVAEKI